MKIFFTILATFTISTFSLFVSRANTPQQSASASQTLQDEVSNSKETFNRIQVGITGSFSFSKLSSETIGSVSEWESANGTSIIPSLEVNYLLSKKLSVGLGIRLGSYSSTYIVKDYDMTISEQYIDIDNDKYYPIYEDVNLTEKNMYKSLDIPLSAKYIINKGKINLYASVGVMFSVYTNMSYTLDGSLTRMGKYTQFSTTLNDYPEYNYTDLTYQSATVNELAAPGIGVFGLLGVGITYEVYNNLAVRAGISTAIGFSDISPEIANTFNDFHSATYLGKTTLGSTALEVGIFYSLFER